MINYPLASDTWDEQEIQALQTVIDSGRYTMGPRVKQFEEEFAKHLGSKYAVMTNSGSSANLISIAAMASDPRFPSTGNIIVPAVSWSTTYFPVHQLGYKLRFVDVEKDTFNIDPQRVLDAIDDETVAVFAVNLLGNACDLEKLLDICKKHNILLLEDNCESLGASIDQHQQAGTVGLMGTHSFFFSHHMQTMEGGMVLTNDEELYHRLRSLRAHGWVRDLPDDNPLYKKSGDPFEDSFRFILPGYCVRPLEMSGAVGSVQLSKWPDMLKWRTNNGTHAKKLFDQVAGIRLQKPNGCSSWFGFGMICEQHLAGRRAEVIDKLNKQGVETRPIVAGNFMRNPVIDHLNWDSAGSFEHADEIHDNGFFIGNDSKDLTKKIDAVAELLGNIT